MPRINRLTQCHICRRYWKQKAGERIPSVQIGRTGDELIRRAICHECFAVFDTHVGPLPAARIMELWT